MHVYEMTIYHEGDVYQKTVIAAAQSVALKAGADSVGLLPGSYGYCVICVRRAQQQEFPSESP